MMNSLKLESLWQIDPKRATPAYTKFDGLDYIPAKNWLVLFGRHFSSIAGVGSIIGPVIAVRYFIQKDLALFIIFLLLISLAGFIAKEILPKLLIRRKRCIGN
jgi:hypothetical protein